jgi:hypothetical protein
MKTSTPQTFRIVTYDNFYNVNRFSEVEIYKTFTVQSRIFAIHKRFHWMDNEWNVSDILSGYAAGILFNGRYPKTPEEALEIAPALLEANFHRVNWALLKVVNPEWEQQCVKS